MRVLRTDDPRRGGLRRYLLMPAQLMFATEENKMDAMLLECKRCTRCIAPNPVQPFISNAALNRVGKPISIHLDIAINKGGAVP